jgi:hypothetical protein
MRGWIATGAERAIAPVLRQLQATRFATLPANVDPAAFPILEERIMRAWDHAGSGKIDIALFLRF